jgi:NAD+ synthase (glutamine-hydrolysing)
MEFGFLRLAAASAHTTVADPKANRLALERLLAHLGEPDIALFPELCLSGYTCGELFRQSTLLDQCLAELAALAESTASHPALIVVGLPLRVGGCLYNMAAAIQSGTVLGLVPKQYLPTYQEFYEGRWFQSGRSQANPGAGPLPPHIELPKLGLIPIGIDLLFQAGQALVGIEICEDLWMPIPPSSLQALAGANVLLNLSASNETIGKASYRNQLITSQSGRCLAAYAYASAGPGESTTDLVFGGHCAIAENGTLLAESARVGSGLVSSQSKYALGTFAVVDIDLQRLQHDRQTTQTFGQGRSQFVTQGVRRIPFAWQPASRPLKRYITGQPFVPKDVHTLDERCQEIFEIQCAGLAKRVQQLPATAPLVIGVSGGLDSTLALLVAQRMCRFYRIPTARIHGLTMPGFGTSELTLRNAKRLMELLEVTSWTTDIRETCLQVFQALGHRPLGLEIKDQPLQVFQRELEALPNQSRNDLVFENVQARVRTLMLMSRGFVLGTGDLSEAALGWCTYNGDHMSMYNVNASVPKTLVRFLVRYVAHHEYDGEIRDCLLSIADTPISPELLPLARDGKIEQSTEASIGPYELHDFFLYHLVRTGASPSKMEYMAQHAEFSTNYSPPQIRQALTIFLKRFFGNQFKRSCVPDGPKVGTVSLSPRGDWRMPSDASVAAWLEDLND